MIYLLFTCTLLAYFYCIICFEQLIKINRIIAIRQNLAEGKYKRFPLSGLIPASLKESIVPTTQVRFKSVKIRLGIFKGFSKVFGVICLAALLFSVLQFWIDRTVNIDLAKTTIFQIEKMQHKLLSLIKPFKPSFGWDLAIIISLIAFAGSVALIESLKIAAVYKKIVRMAGNLLFALTIFTSFTFFGNRLYDREQGREGQMELHKLAIIEKNKLLLHDIQKAVENQVIKAYLETTEVSDIINNNQAYNQTLQSANDDSTIAAIVGNDPPEIFKQRAIEVIKNNFPDGFDFPKILNQAEEKFYEFKNSQKTTYPYFYDYVDQNIEMKTMANAASWFREGDLSPQKNLVASETFIKGYSETPESVSKPFIKYEEPIRKAIKKGYGITIEKWINTFLESLGLDFPFVKDFLDPLIHEPLKDVVVEKSERILKFSMEGNNNAIKQELLSTYEKCKAFFKKILPVYSKFRELQNVVKDKLSRIMNRKALILPEINKLKGQVIAKYRSINWNSRYETMRREFFDNLRNDLFPAMDEDAKSVFHNAFEGWFNYIQRDKIEIGLSDFDNVEDLFINYCRYNPDMTACWGYIVLANETDNIAAKFPGETHLKPYHALRYYFEEFGYDESSIHSIFYTDECDRQVGIVCPIK